MTVLNLEQSRKYLLGSPKATKIYNSLVSKHGKPTIPKDERCGSVCNELNEMIESEMLLIAISEAEEGKKKKQEYWHKQLDILTSLRSNLKVKNICQCTE